jgi:taurine dioxygenase
MTTETYLNAPDPASPLDIVAVGGRIGAEVRGLKLADAQADELIDPLWKALTRHKVLFFRDQHLDDDTHEAFAAAFGDPVPHPTVPVAQGSRTLLGLESRDGYAASSWHTDVTFVDDFPAASILRAIEIPEAGGDTLWANTVAAYDGLPAPLQTLADSLWAVHSNDYDYAAVIPEGAAEKLAQYKAVFTSTIYETEHPVVHVHPLTGEKALLLGHFVKRFTGLSQGESAAVLQLFQAHVTKPENTVRWRWRAGDVAIWDNRATQHRAIADFGRQPRHLRRATLNGTRAVGLDGRTSRLLKPEAAAFAIAAE